MGHRPQAQGRLAELPGQEATWGEKSSQWGWKAAKEALGLFLALAQVLLLINSGFTTHYHYLISTL